MLKVAYFTQSQPADISKEALQFTVFITFEKFEQSETDFDCVLIGDYACEQVTSLIKKLRKHLRFFLLPIFTTADVPTYLQDLCDGNLKQSTWETLIKSAKAINDLGSLLVLPSTPYDLDTKLLQYIFTREKALIAPYLDWQEKPLYIYPLLQTLAVKDNDDFALLKSLQDRNLIEKKVLIDRLHGCSKCHLAHINYIDTCPSCHSINISEMDFLHCFTCGHVGPQDDFMRGDRLKCPRCQAILRHIGSDYDRPIENYHCLDCEDNFSEAEVTAHCLICRHSSSLDRLVPQAIYSYQLTNLGRLNTGNNSIADMYNVFDVLNYLTPEHFNKQLNWMIRLANRHHEINFGILGLEVIGLSQIVMQEGRYAGHMLLEECTERIRQMIRTTDFTTRTSENRLWLLAPQTSSEGCKLLGKRLAEIADITKQQNGTQLTFNVIVLFSGDLSLQDETAETLTMKINEDLDEWMD